MANSKTNETKDTNETSSESSVAMTAILNLQTIVKSLEDKIVELTTEAETLRAHLEGHVEGYNQHILKLHK